MNSDRRFADYKSDNHAWITLITGEYYPDILPRACELYKPVLVVFGHVLRSARGGAQEDDRTGQYRDCAQEVIAYTDAHGMNAKVIFVNDGPGLLLGSMWDDYAYIEDSWNRRVKVVTLRMIADRITYEWLVE